MSYDDYTQIRIDSLLEKFFESELLESEVRVKLKSLNIPSSDVEDLVKSTQDAKRDIQRGLRSNED
tara:strand:+ start:129 stop:326 length:198 start_codon:yes stop_codon:yes gene_type:complete